MSDPVYTGNITDLGHERARRRGDGGESGGPKDPMLERVEALEAGQKTILSKLEEISKSLDAARSDNDKRFNNLEKSVAVIEAKLDTKASSEAVAKVFGDLGQKVVGVERDLISKASATDVSNLKGAVDKLPTTIQLVGFILAVFVATGIAKHYGW